jgi:hypothetical protein
VHVGGAVATIDRVADHLSDGAGFSASSSASTA